MFRSLFGAISTVTVVALLGFALWSCYAVVALNQITISDENGLLENMQQILLVIAGIAFLAPVAFEQRTDKPILLCCSVLCFIFLIREMDIHTFNIPEALKFVATRRGINITVAISLIALFIYAAFRFSYFKNAATRFIQSTPGALLMSGGVLLVVGDFFDKQKWIVYHVYFEEMSELTGYVLIALAAFSTSSFISRARNHSPRAR